MSLSTLRTQVRQLSQSLHLRGEIVVTSIHACQTADQVEDKARVALGREWRGGDLLVTIEVTGEPCPRRTHQHDDPIIIHPRVN
jgi:hypothetical protein